MQNLRRQLKMNLREIKITKAEMTELLWGFGLSWTEIARG